MKFPGVTNQVAQTNQSAAINFPNMPIVAKKNDWQIAHSNEKPIVFSSSKVQNNIGEIQHDGFISSLGKIWQRFSSGSADNTVSRARRDTALEQSQSIRQLLHGAGIPPEGQAKLVNYLNFGLSLSDASDPVYYDGMTMHGLEGKSLNEAFRQVQRKIERLLMFFARNNDDFLWTPNNKQAELLSGFLTANLTGFAFGGLGESDIKYGSKEWAQLRLGLQSLKDQGIDPRTYSEHQLLLLGDTALRTNNTKNKAQLLYLLAGASGRLDLGNLNQKTPQEIQDALTATFKEKFSEELKKTAALAKVAEYHNSLITISNNIPTLPAEYTMDEYNDYAARYSRYRNDFTMTLGRLLDAKIDLLPAWAQEKIQRGKVSIIKPQLSIKYSQNGVETLSDKYKYDLPGSFPLIMQINQEGLNRFFVFSMNTMEPQMIPDKVKPKNWLNQHQTDIVSPEWARKKTDESISNEVRSNIANRREMPEGKNIDVTPFFVTSTENPRTYQQIKLDILNKVGQTIDQNRIKTFDERAGDTYINIFKPIAELIPGAQALISFAEGDVKNALINLGLDIIGAGIAGIEFGALATAISKGAGYLEKTISDGIAEMVTKNKVVISGLEEEPFKVPNQAVRLMVPAEFENVQIGQDISWTHPKTNQSLVVTRLVDDGQVAALQSQGGGSWRQVDWETGQIMNRPLVYKTNGQYGRGNLAGGMPPDKLSASKKVKQTEEGLRAQQQELGTSSSQTISFIDQLKQQDNKKFTRISNFLGYLASDRVNRVDINNLTEEIITNRLNENNVGANYKLNSSDVNAIYKVAQERANPTGEGSDVLKSARAIQGGTERTHLKNGTAIPQNHGVKTWDDLHQKKHKPPADAATIRNDKYIKSMANKAAYYFDENPIQVADLEQTTRRRGWDGQYELIHAFPEDIGASKGESTRFIRIDGDHGHPIPNDQFHSYMEKEHGYINGLPDGWKKNALKKLFNEYLERIDYKLPKLVFTSS